MAQTTVDMALADRESNVRMAGVRMAREMEARQRLPIVPRRSPATPTTASCGRRRSPFGTARTRRCPRPGPSSPSATTATDRWYLGAPASRRTAGLGRMPGRLPRSRTVDAEGAIAISSGGRKGSRTSNLLADLIAAKSTPTSELPRLFRAFDFQFNGQRRRRPRPDEIAFRPNRCLAAIPHCKSSSSRESAGSSRRSLDVKSNPRGGEGRSAPCSIANEGNGRRSSSMLAKFSVPGRDGELLARAPTAPNDQAGVDAMRLLIDRDLKIGTKSAIEVEGSTMRRRTRWSSPRHRRQQQRRRTTLLLVHGRRTRRPTSSCADKRRAGVGSARIATEPSTSPTLERDKKLPKDLLQAAAAPCCTRATWKDVKTCRQSSYSRCRPRRHTDVAAARSRDLVKLKNIRPRWKELFAKAGTCANCHIVNGVGKDVGPNLSEIGKKLSAEALYEPILVSEPPASATTTRRGCWRRRVGEGAGLMVSEDAASGDPEGRATRRTKTSREPTSRALTKSPISLMPADLTKNLSSQDLADVVGYLQTLKEVRKQ